jgi:hypothetical protein
MVEALGEFLDSCFLAIIVDSGNAYSRCKVYGNWITILGITVNNHSSNADRSSSRVGLE